MSIYLNPDIHMWFMFALTAVSIYFFVREKIPLEVTSIILLTILMLLGQFFPLPDANGNNLLNAGDLLAGFANPSLIAVLALLVMGQGIIQTDALRLVTGVFNIQSKFFIWPAIAGILIFVMVISAFMNNTPLVIIAIPILQALIMKAGISQSKIMIPLSYAAILGGMTTLVGSSTNLLVSSAMTELGYSALNFFDFVIPGSILAGTGFIYVIFVAPFLLKGRSSMSDDLIGDEKEFVAELEVGEDSKLIGMACEEGQFAALKNLNLKLIQRHGHILLPPFEGYVIEAGDTMIVSATRNALMDLLAKHPGFLLSEEDNQLMLEQKVKEDEIGGADIQPPTRVLAEIMITPASRMIDMSLDHANLQKKYGVVVLGIQRRARVVRRKLGRIRLEPGDVLLVVGRRRTLESMRDNPDFIILSGSKKDIPLTTKAPIAALIFIGVIVSAALGLLSIPVAAITGSVLMIVTGCLNIRQATRAIDRKIFLLVGSMLALGIGLQATGGAAYLAERILDLPFANEPLIMASILFLLVALCTNILTNNACAILFTPIAMNLAGNLNVPPGLEYDIAFIFAVTVVFGANCSFASPIGYQTNLLVMGPGHYRFSDFFKAGVPLVIILWLTYIAVAKFYYGL